ncbi:hypothetical protein GCM10027200_03540 [Lentzea nigeriaca]
MGIYGFGGSAHLAAQVAIARGYEVRSPQARMRGSACAGARPPRIVAATTVPAFSLVENIGNLPRQPGTLSLAFLTGKAIEAIRFEFER